MLFNSDNNVLLNKPVEKNFVNIQKILDKYQIEWKNNSVLLCLNAMRNNGKSTAAFNFFFEENGVNEQNQILLIRNTEEEVKNLKQDFNSRFFGRYTISGSLIYEIKDCGLNKEGEAILKRGKHVGYVGAISTYQKLKSMKAENIRWILYDEYADKNVFDIYDKFISMIKTFERFNRVFILMLGNRETANNEFMNKWGVIPNTLDYDNDRFVQFSQRGFFIELGNKQFESLGNDKTLSNELAVFDYKSNLYLNQGGYKYDNSLKVVPFKNLDIDKYIFGLAYKNVYFALVTLKTGGCAICRDNEVKEYLINNRMEVLAFDSISYIEKETELIDMETRSNIATDIINFYKSDLLLFDSFDCLQFVENISMFVRTPSSTLFRLNR